MTGDEVFNNDDELNPEDENLEIGDEEFVIDEWDLFGDEGAQAPPDFEDELFAIEGEVEASVEDGSDVPIPGNKGQIPDPFAMPARAARSERREDETISGLGHVGTEEEDLLFSGRPEDLPDNVLGESRVFSEDGTDSWGGENVELADLGMDMADDGTPRGPVHMAPDFDDGVFDIDGDDLTVVDVDDFETTSDSERPAVASEARGEPVHEDISEEDFSIDFDAADDFELDIGEQPQSAPDRIEYAPDFEIDVEDADDFVHGEFEANTLEPLDEEFEDFAGDLGADLNVQPQPMLRGYDEEELERADFEDGDFANADFEEGEEGDFEGGEFEEGEFEEGEFEEGEFEEEQYTAPIDYNTRDFAVDESTEEEWAPVSQHYEDVEEEYDDDEVYDEEFDEHADEEGDPDYSEYEEAYFDETGGYAPYEEEARSSRFRWVAGIAAGVLIAAAAAFWFFKTDSLTDETPGDVIEVIKVTRPDPKIDPAKTDPAKTDPAKTDPGQTDPGQTDPGKTDPGQTDPGQTDPGQTDPGQTDPGKTDPGQTDPGQTDPGKTDPGQTDPGKTDPGQTDPGQTDPGKTDPGQTDPGQTDPGQTDPGQTDPGKTDPGKTDPGQTDPGQTDPIVDPKSLKPERPDGPELTTVGDDGTAVSAEDVGIMERHMQQTVESHNGLIMGSQALAQLDNENIFVGRVKALNSSFITLSTNDGEITLERSALRALTTLEAAEYEEWKNVSTTGRIKLRNNNRLTGKIIEARDDAVILMVNSNRVIIPKHAIESVSADVRKGVNLDASEAIENDDWFRQLVEKKIQQNDKAREAAPTKTATPVK